MPSFLFSVTALARAQYPARPPVDPAVLERGKALYSVHCAFCHGTDARGGDGGGPNLLRSQLVLSDRKGELIGDVVRNGRPATGMPPIALGQPQIADIADFIHSFSVGGDDAARNVPVTVVVGNATSGAAAFQARCAGCHSTTGDLKGIGARFAVARELQDYWLMPVAGRGRGTGPGANLKPVTAIVTLPSGERSEGRLLRIDDFTVTIVPSGRWHAAIVRPARRRAEGRDRRSGQAAPRSAPALHGQGDSGHHGVPGFVEMKSLTPLLIGLLVVIVGTPPSFIAQRLWLDPAEITKPLGATWPTYSGDYTGKRFSSLNEVNTSNIRSLTLAWTARVTAGPNGGAPRWWRPDHRRRRRAGRERSAAAPTSRDPSSRSTTCSTSRRPTTSGPWTHATGERSGTTSGKRAAASTSATAASGSTVTGCSSRRPTTISSAWTLAPARSGGTR